MEPFRPTFAQVLVTLLIFAALAAALALFMVPVHSPWFWPAAAGFAVCAGLAMLIRLHPRP